MTLKDKVFDALDTAVIENGYTDILVQSDDYIALDIVTHDAGLENEDPDELIQWIAEWRVDYREGKRSGA